MKKKKTLVKQNGDLFLVWTNHPITKRKLQTGVYLKMSIKIHLACMQSYRRHTGQKKNKYQFIAGDYPQNVVVKVLVHKR